MKTAKIILSTVAIGVTILFSGCGVTDVASDFSPSIPSGGSQSASGHDKVKVTLLDDNTLRIHWDKNYRGFSEVLARADGVNHRTNYFMTPNSTGSYELTCYTNSLEYSRVVFDCVNTGNGYLSESSILPPLTYDTIYNIQVSENINHDYQSISAKLSYNSTTNALELH